MGFQFDVIFIDSFMDDITYVRDVQFCVVHMICYIRGCICYGSENFGLGSLHDDYVGLAPKHQYHCLRQILEFHACHCTVTLRHM